MIPHIGRVSRLPLRPQAPNLKLKELRINRGWSPAQLGYQAGGLSARAIRDIEEGRTREPQARTKFALASALGVNHTEIWPLSRRARVR
jgi:transcriptional regulator with XRE-family HTH domain